MTHDFGLVQPGDELRSPSRRHRPRSRRTLAIFTSALGLAFAAACADQSHGSAEHGPETGLRAGDVTVLLPDGRTLGEDHIASIAHIVVSQSDLVGFPKGWHLTGRIAVRLAKGSWNEAEGRAEFWARSVVLPYPEALQWPMRRLAAVIRHELVHIAIAEFVDNKHLPVWLDEGFAEWEGGALDDDLALRLEMQCLLNSTPWPPELVSLGSSRMHYDLAATFLEFVDSESSGLVRSGDLLAAVRDRGIYRAIEFVLQRNFRSAEQDWGNHVRNVYCSPQN